MTDPIPLPDLHQLAAELLRRLGARTGDAELAADVLTYADARGLHSHGVGAIGSIYGPRLLDGRINGPAVAETVTTRGATAVIDGRRALGLVTMSRAVTKACDLARQFGVGTVVVRNSSHFGAAGFYAHRVAQMGMIGLVGTNCGNQGVVTPLGGSLRLLGTNPLAAASPGGGRAPFVLDMSTTVAPTGKVAAARRDGSSVPAGWLVGADGGDVTDPAAYFDGRAELRWLGGDLARGAAKGFGLAMLVDLLCGPLAAAGFGPRQAAIAAGRPGADDDDVGHFAFVIDPAAFGSAVDFDAACEELLGSVAACPPAAGHERVTYPGEPEARRAEATERDGVRLPQPLVPALLDLADHLGVVVPSALGADQGELVP